MSIIKKAMAGAGDALVTAGLDSFRAQLQEARDARLNEYQTTRDTRQNEFTSGENARNREHTSTENAANRTHQTNLQDRGFGHAERMQDKAFSHAELMQINQQDFQRDEGDKNRSIQAAGQSIQLRQVAVLERGAALEHRIKEVQAQNAEEVGRLQEKYRVETDPNKKAALRDSIAVLTGKASDKFLPLPLKDEMGNITGYQIFDTHRGAIFEPNRGGGGGSVAPATTDIEALKRMSNNPQAVKLFEEKFGQGSAAKYLKAEAPAQRPASAGGTRGGMIQNNMGLAGAMDAVAPRQPTAQTQDDTPVVMP